MALQLDAKVPSAVIRYSWVPPVVDGDSLSTATLAVSSGTAVIDSYEVESGEVLAFISGGAAGETTVITASAVTSDGETLTETIYLPIRASTVGFTYTARDVCNFALRKVVGNGNDPEASEADDALERLNDMLAMWRIDGLDVGVAEVMTLGDTLAIPDEYISALKFNLRIACHDHYDAPITPHDAEMADRSKRLIANRLLNMGDQAMPASLSYPSDRVADLF